MRKLLEPEVQILWDEAAAERPMIATTNLHSQGVRVEKPDGDSLMMIMTTRTERRERSRMLKLEARDCNGSKQAHHGGRRVAEGHACLLTDAPRRREPCWVVLGGS